ncbi:MAG: hypothetical protein PHP10_03035 [Candidatus Omnitrophica bacterium]|nr:hypothetical protein [Candidatus Omnitrophota bacterium]
MKLNRISGVLVLLITMTAFAAFAEEPGAGAPVVSIEPNYPAQNENNAQWAWGEVTNLDGQAKTLTLKYLDYETDQEKELILAVDENTTYDNIKNFDEIKVKDALSVDYAAGPGDKYIAKNISLETPDTTVPQPAASTEMPASGAAAEGQAQ